MTSSLSHCLDNSSLETHPTRCPVLYCCMNEKYTVTVLSHWNGRNVCYCNEPTLINILSLWSLSWSPELTILFPILFLYFMHTFTTIHSTLSNSTFFTHQLPLLVYELQEGRDAVPVIFESQHIADAHLKIVRFSDCNVSMTHNHSFTLKCFSSQWKHFPLSITGFL